MLEEFLQLHLDDSPFLYYKKEMLSRKAFSQEVLQLSKTIPDSDEKNTFVYLQTEEPIDFYIALFTLWYKGFRVVLPTKLSLEEQHAPEYATYIFSKQDNGWDLQPNPHSSIQPPEGDTVVFSSGSTGTPKGIVHKKEHFFINAKETYAHIRIHQTTSLCYLKPYLVSAISHVMVHWYGRSTIIFDHFENIHRLSDYHTLTSTLNIVGSPIHITTAFSYLKTSALSPQFFFSSGDMISDAHIESILDHFPQAIFFKVYGLAEVAGRLFVKRLTRTTIAPDMGTHLPVMDVRIIDNEVVVDSPILFLGYLIDDQYHPRKGSFHTGDLVEAGENDQWILKGRKNDEVKVAGNKVAVKYLENIITNVLKSYHVDFISVIPIPHDFFGNTLALILSQNGQLTANALISILRGSLASYQVPHAYYQIDTANIPFTQTMKIDRKKLQEMVLNQELERL